MFSNLRSLIFKLDPEKAHTLAIKSLKFNFVPNLFQEEENDNLFKTTLFNIDLKNPIELFKIWMEEAKVSEPNDPNALALATADKKAIPSVRMVLLKDFSNEGFVFYTNLESQKGNELKENPNASMCFHWKSLLRQVRINGNLLKVADDVADEYYNSRAYNSRIVAWASKQSKILKNRNDLILGPK